MGSVVVEEESSGDIFEVEADVPCVVIADASEEEPGVVVELLLPTVILLLLLLLLFTSFLFTASFTESLLMPDGLIGVSSFICCKLDCLFCILFVLQKELYIIDVVLRGGGGGVVLLVLLLDDDEDDGDDDEDSICNLLRVTNIDSGFEFQ